MSAQDRIALLIIGHRERIWNGYGTNTKQIKNGNGMRVEQQQNTLCQAFPECSSNVLTAGQ